ncbi:MAG: hypothetical protein ABIO70_21940 [Pseudomonadota bacterium]
MSRLLPLLLAGCWCPPLVGPTAPEEEPEWDRVCDEATLESQGRAPQDGVRILLGPEGCSGDGELDHGIALLEGDDGGRVTVQPWGTCGRWLPEGGFDAGTWRFTAWREPGDEPIAWTTAGWHMVGPWGTDDAFERTSVANSTWRLDDIGESCTFPWGPEIGSGFARPLWLWIGGVTATGAEVALIGTDEDGHPDSARVAATGEAELSSSGALTWTLPSLAFPFPANQLQPAWDLRLDMAFDASGAEARGGALSLTLGLTEVPESIDGVDGIDDLCALMGSFGNPCGPCPEGDSEHCVALESWAGIPERDE